MPIGTSSGQYYEDEFEYTAAQLQSQGVPRIRVTPVSNEPSKGSSEGTSGNESGVLFSAGPAANDEGGMIKPWSGSIAEVYNMYRNSHNLDHERALESTYNHIKRVQEYQKQGANVFRQELPLFDSTEELENYLSKTPMSSLPQATKVSDTLSRPALPQSEQPSEIDHLLDPIMPGERYDDSPTTMQRQRDNPYGDNRSPYNYLKDEEYKMEQQLRQADPNWELEPHIAPQTVQYKPTEDYQTEPKMERYGQKALESLAGVVRDKTLSVVNNASTIAQGLTGTGKFEGNRHQTVPEKMVRSFINSVQVLDGVMRGQIDHRDAIPAAFEVASAITLGPAPLARKAVDGSLGIMAGVRAKGAAQTKLTVAGLMEKRGSSPDLIWEKTGWYRGFDNEWRFEIPDTNAFIKQHPDAVGPPMKLKDVLEHPALFKHYPQFKDLKVVFDPDMPANTMGFFWPRGYYDGIWSNGHIAIGKSFQNLSPAEQRRTILHEVQHVVQDTEPGFYAGRGDPLTNRITLNQAIEAKTQELAKVDPEKAKLFKAETERLIAEAEGKTKDIGMEFYWRDPAEQEARLVEGRSVWSKKDLKENPMQTYAGNPEHFGGDPLIYPEVKTESVPKMKTEPGDNVTQFRRGANENKDLSKLSFQELDDEYKNLVKITTDMTLKQIDHLANTGQLLYKEEQFKSMQHRKNLLYNARNEKMNEGMDKMVDEAWAELTGGNKKWETAEIKKELRERTKIFEEHGQFLSLMDDETRNLTVEKMLEDRLQNLYEEKMAQRLNNLGSSDKQKFTEAVRKQKEEVYKVVDAKDAKTIDEWRKISQQEKVFVSGRPNGFAMARKHSLNGNTAVVIGVDGRRTIFKNGVKVFRDKLKGKDDSEP
jgi:hypothetical protein